MSGDRCLHLSHPEPCGCPGSFLALSLQLPDDRHQMDTNHGNTRSLSAVAQSSEELRFAHFWNSPFRPGRVGASLHCLHLSHLISPRAALSQVLVSGGCNGDTTQLLDTSTEQLPV